MFSLVETGSTITGSQVRDFLKEKPRRFERSETLARNRRGTTQRHARERSLAPFETPRPRSRDCTMKDLLDDVPLPEANHLLLSGAVLAGSAGLATVMKPTKMHEAYFTETGKNDEPMIQHKPSTRWLGMSLCWVGGMNCAAALAPKGNKVKRNLLVANAAGLLAGAPYAAENEDAKLARSTYRRCGDSRLGASEILRPDRPATPRLETLSETSQVTSPENPSRKPSVPRRRDGRLQPGEEYPEEEDHRVRDRHNRHSGRAEPRARHQGQGRRGRRRVSRATSLRRLRKTKASSEARERRKRRGREGREG